MVEESNDVRILSRSTARELADMRGSRTLSIAFPMRYLSRAGLTRNNFRKARSDHPSVTLALIPSAPSRKRTARTDRRRRRAIFFTGSYPASLNNLSSSSSVQGLPDGLRTVPVFPDFFALLGWQLSRTASLEALRS